MDVMYFVVYISIFIFNFHSSNGANNTEVQSTTIRGADIAEALIILLGYDGKNDSKRLKELRDKIAKIDSYVIDRNKYSDLLKSEIRRNELNATNFYKALIGEDHYRIWNASKSLYLKLKEKMNRDDVLKILSERGEEKVMKYARRMMGDSDIADKPVDIHIDEVVDKYIGESPIDNHTFSENERYSHVWDPQLELEERLEKSKMGGRRIYKGERTTIRYYPFMVSVHIMGRFWCGGVIYHSDLVLTSASCLQLMHNNRFFRENPRALSVRVGSNHSRIGGEVIDALEVYFHPGYAPRTLRSNLALIRLVRHLKFNYHRIPKTIQISTNEMGIAFTAKVLLLGWGVTKVNQKLAFEPIFLQNKELPVYPNKFCEEVYGKKFIKETMFCAGTVTTGEGACDHDAGGPAVLNGKLVGIISFGPTICGFPDAPTVFTLVGAFADWIETVNETMPGYYRAQKRTTTTTTNPMIEYFATATRRPIKSVVTAPPEMLQKLMDEKEKQTSMEKAKGDEVLRSQNDFQLHPVNRF